MRAIHELIQDFSRNAQTLSRAGLTLAVRLSGSLAAFFLTTFLARSMGASEAGAFFWAANLLLGMSYVTRLGLDMTLLRLASPAWEREDRGHIASLLRQGLLGAAGASLLAALVGAGVTFVAGDRLLPSAEYRGAFYLALLILTPFTLAFPLASLAKGVRMPELGGLLERAGLPMFALAFIGASFIWLAPTAENALLAYGAASVLLVGVGLAAIRRRLASAHGGQVAWRPLLEQAFPVIILSVAGFTVNWWSGFVLAWHAPANEVGIFNAAQRIANVNILVLQAFVSVYAPRFPGLYERGEIAALGALVKRGTRTMFLAGLPLILPMLLAPGYVMSFFGPEYVAGGPYLVWLTLGQVVNLGTGCAGILLLMTGHEKVMRNVVVGTSLLVVGISWPLLTIWGSAGAAAVTTLGLVVQNVAAAYMVKKKLKISSLLW